MGTRLCRFSDLKFPLGLNKGPVLSFSPCLRLDGQAAAGAQIPQRLVYRQGRGLATRCLGLPVEREEKPSPGKMRVRAAGGRRRPESWRAAPAGRGGHDVQVRRQPGGATSSPPPTSRMLPPPCLHWVSPHHARQDQPCPLRSGSPAPALAPHPASPKRPPEGAHEHPSQVPPCSARSPPGFLGPRRKSPSLPCAVP